MSLSNAIQKAIFLALTGDAGVSARVGARVADRPPETMAFPNITFGPSDFLPDDFECLPGRIETVQLDVWSRAQDGKREAKAITDAVVDALHEQPLTLETGRAVRVSLDLARMIDDPDGITSHGILQFSVEAEA